MTIASLPDAPAEIRFADRPINPLRVAIIRFLVAVGVVFLIASVVYFDRHDYRDSAGGEISFADALYYSTVSVTTTGYGDIVPVTPQSRLVTTVVVTPLRVAFLVLVVSTTVEVLTARSRHVIRVSRWRAKVHGHYVICGFGTKGRSAAVSLTTKGVAQDQIVVVDTRSEAIDEANAEGYVVVVGDCTRESVLRQAGVERARGVVVAVGTDATAVLATLTVRLLNARTRIVAAVREEENSQILRRGGASVVVTSDEATGRLLGLAIDNPHQAEMIEDLLMVGQGLDLIEREITEVETGRTPPEGTVGIIRHGRMFAEVAALQPGDRLLVIEGAGTEA
ncbi:MAG: potassium channel family protein [Acidimicrobiia bacterium]